MKNSYKIILHTIAITIPIGLIAEPIVHIKNKSKEAIQIQINNGPLKNIAAGNDLSDDTNVLDISGLTIYYCAKKNCGNNKDQLQVTFGQVNRDTTLYVKFDIKSGKGILEPQKGDWFGKTTKTTEKYSLRNNIKESDIYSRIEKSGQSGKTPTSTSRDVSTVEELKKDIDNLAKNIKNMSTEEARKKYNRMSTITDENGRKLIFELDAKYKRKYVELEDDIMD